MRNPQRDCRPSFFGGLSCWIVLLIVSSPSAQPPVVADAEQDSGRKNDRDPNTGASYRRQEEPNSSHRGRDHRYSRSLLVQKIHDSPLALCSPMVEGIASNGLWQVILRAALGLACAALYWVGAVPLRAGGRQQRGRRRNHQWDRPQTIGFRALVLHHGWLERPTVGIVHP